MLFERARREGEADRRRIERMVEAGVERARDGKSRLRETPVWRARAPNRWSTNLLRGSRPRMSKALVDGCPQWLIFEAEERGIVFTHGDWRHGCGQAAWRCSLPGAPDAMVECEGECGAPGRARSGRSLLG